MHLGPLVCLLIFAIGMLSFPLAVLGWDLTHLPGDPIDTRFNLYILEHGYLCFLGEARSFWDAPIFFPARLITAYSDAHLGTLPFYIWLRQMGCDPFRALQIWWLVPYGLNYFSAVLTLRTMGCGWFGASCGAYLFAFGLAAQTPTITHVQLGPRFLVPPLIYLAWSWPFQPSLWRLSLFGVLLVAQTYLTIYLGYFCGLFVAVMWFIQLISYRDSLPWDRILPRRVLPWLSRFGVALALLATLAPLVLPYLRVSPERGHFSPEFLLYFLPRWESWVTPSPVSNHALWMGHLTPVAEPTSHELHLFPGFACVAALLFGLLTITRAGRERSLILVLTLSILGVMLLTLRWEHASLYFPLFHLPAIKGIQAVSRIVLVLLFPLGYLLAQLLQAMSNKGWACIILGWLVVADQSLNRPDISEKMWINFRFSVADVQNRQSKMKQLILAHPSPRLVYVFPVQPENEEESRRLRLDLMLASQQLGIPCVNGWSGSTPLTYWQFTSREQLMHWLTVEHQVDPEMLRGLVVLGKPWQD
jgi:hypothetical protein